MDDKPKGHIAQYVTYSLVLFVILYPLSVRPIVWLYNHNMIPDSVMRWLEIIYFPIGLLSEVPYLAGPLKAYIEWWE